MCPTVVHAACCAPRRHVFVLWLFFFIFSLGLSVCTVRIYTAKWQLWACERDFRALKYHLWSSTSSGQSLCFFSDFFLCVENKSDSELAHRQTPVLRAVHDHWTSSLALVVCCDSTVSSADLDGTAAPENRRTGALYLAAISCLVRGGLTLNFSTFFFVPPSQLRVVSGHMCQRSSPHSPARCLKTWVVTHPFYSAMCEPQR